MLDERVEITIAVQQRKAIKDAAGGDQRIDRLADRNAEAAEMAIVAGGFNGDAVVTDRYPVELGHPGQHLLEVSRAPGALQDFREDQVTNEQASAPCGDIFQRDRLERDAMGSQIDPDA